MIVHPSSSELGNVLCSAIFSLAQHNLRTEDVRNATVPQWSSFRWTATLSHSARSDPLKDQERSAVRQRLQRRTAREKAAPAPRAIRGAKEAAAPPKEEQATLVNDRDVCQRPRGLGVCHHSYVPPVPSLAGTMCVIPPTTTRQPLIETP